jgi:hypothetical protein
MALDAAVAPGETRRIRPVRAERVKHLTLPGIQRRKFKDIAVLHEAYDDAVVEVHGAWRRALFRSHRLPTL